MKSLLLILALTSLTAAASAQTQTAKDSITAGTATPTYGNFISFPAAAEIHEDLSDKGVYSLTFTDPNNEWRCYVTSTTAEHPGNVIHTELSSMGITCVKTHKVGK